MISLQYLNDDEMSVVKAFPRQKGQTPYLTVRHKLGWTDEKLGKVLAPLERDKVVSRDGASLYLSEWALTQLATGQYTIGGQKRKTGVDEHGLPYPRVLLGSSAAWYNDDAKPAVCPICKGLPLKSYMYCLRCDRWGAESAA